MAELRKQRKSPKLAPPRAPTKTCPPNFPRELSTCLSMQRIRDSNRVSPALVSAKVRETGNAHSIKVRRSFDYSANLSEIKRRITSQHYKQDGISHSIARQPLLGRGILRRRRTGTPPPTRKPIRTRTSRGGPVRKSPSVEDLHSGSGRSSRISTGSASGKTCVR